MYYKDIGFEIKTLSNLVSRLIVRYSQDSPELRDTTNMHIRIIGYLYDNPGRDIFQRDLEEHFMIRRSTVTSIVTLMEKKSLIIREAVSHDARLKKLVPTQKAVDIYLESRKVADQVEGLLRSGLTDEETEMLFNIIKKIKEAIQ